MPLPRHWITNPALLGAGTQAEAEAETRGTLQPSFPQTSRLPGYFPARFSKEVQEEERWGAPREFLENKRRHTKEDQGSGEGGRLLGSDRDSWELLGGGVGRGSGWWPDQGFHRKGRGGPGAGPKKKQGEHATSKREREVTGTRCRARGLGQRAEGSGGLLPCQAPAPRCPAQAQLPPQPSLVFSNQINLAVVKLIM